MNKSKIKRKLKKSIKYKIKSKTKYKTKKYLSRGRGGGGESLSISYPGIIQLNNIDLTGKPNIYNIAPTVVINNAVPNKIYMVTMTDPDAPNGMEETDKSKNHVFTHWVYIQQNNTKTEYVPYAPPSPPKGTHRYQFKLYDVSGIGKENLDLYLKMGNNNRMNYFDNKLKKFNNNNNGTNKNLIYFDENISQYKVSAMK
jgi:phosphatidylethanolamine-binding protein (PEBP) family uncharacterized protein